MDNKWNNNKLEPVLITYNRAEDLMRTLDAFIAADLTWMTLHVLDNASTDNTKLVVNAAQKKWPNLTYHRNLYNIGGVGIPKDYAEAMKWYLLAAEQGYAGAQNNLGLVYGNGEGVPKDSAEAVKW